MKGSLYLGLPGPMKYVGTGYLKNGVFEMHVLLGTKSLKKSAPLKYLYEPIDYSTLSFCMIGGDLPKKGSEESYIYFVNGSITDLKIDPKTKISHPVLLTRGAQSVHKAVVALYLIVLTITVIWIFRINSVDKKK